MRLLLGSHSFECPAVVKLFAPLSIFSPVGGLASGSPAPADISLLLVGFPAFVGIPAHCDKGGLCCGLLFCGGQQFWGELLHVAGSLSSAVTALSHIYMLQVDAMLIPCISPLLCSLVHKYSRDHKS